MMAKVKDYMTDRVVTVTPRDTLGRARNLMLERKIRRLVVVEGNSVVGIITATDIARALARRGAPWRWRNPENSLVDRFMTKNPVTIGPDELIRAASKVMDERGIGGLPVVKDSSLIGILTETDVSKFFADNMRGHYRIKDLMEGNYQVIAPNTNLKKVAKLIAGGNRVLVVGSEGRYLGMITEGDIALWEPNLAKKYVLIPSRTGRISVDVRVKTARHIMKEIEVKLNPEEDAAKAARYMIEWGVSAIPVFDGGELVGIVDKKALVRGVANASE